MKKLHLYPVDLQTDDLRILRSPRPANDSRAREAPRDARGIRFGRHAVTFGPHKAKVLYSHGPLTTGRDAVTLYEKGYEGNLGKIFGKRYENATDMQSDYFDEGHVRIYAGDPLYADALERSMQNKAEDAERWKKTLARRDAKRSQPNRTR
jgi:hypothetical protein